MSGMLARWTHHQSKYYTLFTPYATPRRAVMVSGTDLRICISQSCNPAPGTLATVADRHHFSHSPGGRCWRSRSLAPLRSFAKVSCGLTPRRDSPASPSRRSAPSFAALIHISGRVRDGSTGARYGEDPLRRARSAARRAE